MLKRCAATAGLKGHLCFRAMQVAIQLLHEAVEAAVALAVAPALHLHSALRACRLAAPDRHQLTLLSDNLPLHEGRASDQLSLFLRPQRPSVLMGGYEFESDVHPSHRKP